MTKAKDLLTRTDTSIKQIASIIGFSDDKYFMRVFKKYEKLTSTKFRKAFYQNQLNND